MIDITDHIARRQLVMKMQADIDAFCRKEFSEPPRTHLGASVIGHDCQAYLWGVFRWLKQENFDGRMYRLFNRGHTEEARIVRWLTGAGFEVREFDPATQKQFRITGSLGHFGGSLDGFAKLPESYGLGELVVVTEFKTHSLKQFTKLKEVGVVKSHPKHFRQMSCYGRAYNLPFGLYVAACKDTDELHIEIVPLDFKLAEDLFRKADSVIFSQTQPPKVAMVETYVDCKYCTFAGICHRGEAPAVNCRSCKHASPGENASWHCGLADPSYNPIPARIIAVGCANWTRII